LTPPLAIDLSSLDAAYVRKRFGLNGKSCVFLFTFVSHTGGGFERKNPFAVIEAFRSAFTRGEEAVLVIKTTPPYPLAFAKNLRSYVRGYREHSRLTKASSGRVIIVDEYMTNTELLSLISSCDCLVSLHRSEGFGQALAEAMYLGKPVIATAFSGNLDFMRSDNSLLVDYTIVPTGREFEAFGPGSESYTWAEPDIDHASELMRWVFLHRGEARALGEKAALGIRELMNPARVGQNIREKCANLMCT